MGNSNWLALTGGAGTGKTTLARALQKEGYQLINFTDRLKEELLRALYHVDVHITLDQLKENKEKYRPLLQEFGSVIGYDTCPEFIYDALNQWAVTGKGRCVFDNVRTKDQWETLKELGFTLVRLEDAHPLTFSQALDNMFSPKKIVHPVERGFYEEDCIRFKYHEELEYMVWKLVSAAKKYQEGEDHITKSSVPTVGQNS